MKNWLVTTSTEHDLDTLRDEVAALGGKLSDAPPVPLDEGEQAVEVVGPDDLGEKLSENPGVRRVNEDSAIQMYDQ